MLDLAQLPVGVVGVAGNDHGGAGFAGEQARGPRPDGLALRRLLVGLGADGPEKVDGENVDAGPVTGGVHQQVLAHHAVQLTYPALRRHLPPRQVVQDPDFLASGGVLALAPGPRHPGRGGQGGDFRPAPGFLQGHNLVALGQRGEVRGLGPVLIGGHLDAIVNFAGVVDGGVEVEIRVQGADLQVDGQRGGRDDQVEGEVAEQSRRLETISG